jgi:hypothetical protein
VHDHHVGAGLRQAETVRVADAEVDPPAQALGGREALARLDEMAADVDGDDLSARAATPVPQPRSRMASAPVRASASMYSPMAERKNGCRPRPSSRSAMTARVRSSISCVRP